MREPGQFHTVRLVAAGAASLLALPCFALAVGRLLASPPVLEWLAPLPTLLASAALSLIALVTLTPVLARGSRGDRWLASFLLPFPLLVFAVAVWILMGHSLQAIRF